MGKIPSREELIDLYKIHAEEVRFEVKLNWDRAQYLLVLNVGILGAAATIWKAEAVLPHYVLLTGLFLVGLCTSIVAQAAIKKGHSYYHKARRQKTLVEYLLELHQVPLNLPNSPTADLTISTTEGMAKEISAITSKHHEPDFTQLQGGQVTWYLIQVFRLLSFLNLLGLLIGVSYVISFSPIGPQWKLGVFDLGLFLTIATAVLVPLLIFAWLIHRSPTPKLKS